MRKKSDKTLPKRPDARFTFALSGDAGISSEESFSTIAECHAQLNALIVPTPEAAPASVRQRVMIIGVVYDLELPGLTPIPKSDGLRKHKGYTSSERT